MLPLFFTLPHHFQHIIHEIMESDFEQQIAKRRAFSALYIARGFNLKHAAYYADWPWTSLIAKLEAWDESKSDSEENLSIHYYDRESS